VVLEGAREDAPPAGVEGGGDGVARERLDGLAVEREADGPRAVDALAGLLRKAGHSAAAPDGPPSALSDAEAGVPPAGEASGASAGVAVQCTSLVRVSRSARNHAPQPERCTHHSRWTPAALRLK
jgi:hypothetical protein